MRAALLLALVALAAVAATAPAAQAQPPPLPCGAYVVPDPANPHAAVGCGTFACYVNEDYGFRCFG
jgi:ABC-type oligopeptide transport system substrate-binding subunit